MGLGATGLAVARALGRRGYSVLGIDHRPWEVARLSRYVNSTASDVDDAIRRLGGRSPDPSERPILFACGDPELAQVDAARERLSAHAQLPPPAEWLDKRRLYAAAQDAGVAVPAFAVDAPPDAPGPWIVKPARAGASETRPFPEKARLTARLEPHWRDVVVQAYVPGGSESLVVWAAHSGADGRIGPWVTGVKRRERPRLGSASWLETTRDDEVDAASRALCQALPLHGTVAIEWKRADGRLWLIEVNTRPVLWSAVADEVLVDAFQERRGLPRPPAEPVPAGRTWRYAARDPLSPAAQVDALWAVDDPLPGLAGPLYTGVLALARLSGRRFV